MKPLFFGVAFYFILCYCYSQERTNYWPLGYASYTPDTLAGGITMTFINGVMSYYSHPRKMWFDYTNASICNDSGQFQFYSNGIWIGNNMEDTMLNGTGLNPSWYTTQYSYWGIGIAQGNIIIPKPGDTSKYYLFHETIDIPVIYYPNKLYVTTVDMQGDSGKGEVIDKNKILLNDTLVAGSLTACKHANGRDWWLIVPEYGEELGFYTFIITPDTIQQVNYQKANAGGMGRMQSCFSPDGTKYIISNWFGIAFYDFDRCTGSISFSDSIAPDIDSLNWFGASISPNSRYAYSCGDNGYNFYQFDLQSTDISASKTLVAQWDTFAYPWPPWWTAFYMHQIGPDGKIYVSCPGTTMALHIIDDPDSTGIACDLQQHAILLPHFNATIPNFPNYNLGRLQGSPCDTLQWAGVDDAQQDFKFKVFPNPNDGHFKISYQLPQNKNGMLEVFDITGKVVYQQNLPQWSSMQSISLKNLSDGIYNATIISDEKRVNKTIVIINE